MRLQSKVIVVTGGSGLLGQQHCMAVLEAGGMAVGLDIDTKGMDNFSSSLPSKLSERFLALDCDITRAEELDRVLEIITKHFGIPTGLVNNAAINPSVEKNGNRFNRIEDISKEDWNLEFDVGLWGAFLASRIFGMAMIENNLQGSIVNISSDHGVIAPNQGLYRQEGVADENQPVKPVTYSVIKHGLIGLTKYLATYWAKNGITVNTLCPGGVLNGQDNNFIQKFEKVVPLGRLANPNEYRGALVYLLSDESSYMTGSTMVIDGGRSIW